MAQYSRAADGEPEEKVFYSRRRGQNKSGGQDGDEPLYSIQAEAKVGPLFTEGPCQIGRADVA